MKRKKEINVLTIMNPFLSFLFLSLSLSVLLKKFTLHFTNQKKANKSERVCRSCPLQKNERRAFINVTLNTPYFIVNKHYLCLQISTFKSFSSVFFLNNQFIGLCFCFIFFCVCHNHVTPIAPLSILQSYSSPSSCFNLVCIS